MHCGAHGTGRDRLSLSLQLKLGDAAVTAYAEAGGTGSAHLVDICKKLAKRMTGDTDEESGGEAEE